MKWKPKNSEELLEIIEEIVNNQLNNNNYPYGLRDVDVSNITDMSNLFSECILDKNSKINIKIDWCDPRNNITNWDVSNVTSMAGMFDTSLFNQDIGHWNVSSVTNMRSMFYESNFNQDISRWNVSQVINMSDMFFNSDFNQPIGNWDVSHVTNMEYMFAFSPFNQNLYKWIDKLNKNVNLLFFNINSEHEKKYGLINSIESFIDKQKNDIELNDNELINEQNSDFGYNEIDVLYTSFKTFSKEEFNQYISDIDEKTIISFAKDLNSKDWIELVNKIDNPNLKMEILKSKIDIDINSKDEVKENLSNDNKVINININLDLGDLDR